MSRPLILASESPRRRTLLAEAGFTFEVVPADIDERYPGGEMPREHVLRLAREKANAVAQQFPGAMVIGADTIVVLTDRIYGKPASLTEAKATLETFSGKTHEVLTGVCLQCLETGFDSAWVCTTRVTFRPFDRDTIETYCRLVNPLDKAGSYGIQEHGDLLVAQIEGLLSNVIGLPVEEIQARLAQPE